MTVASLGRLFVSGRDAASPVALRDGSAIPFARFTADVAHIAAMARAAGIRRGAVLSADPYRFLIGLFGLLHAGATAILPPDGLPDTLAQLRSRFDALLADAPPPSVAALPIEEGHSGTTLSDALDPAAAMLEFFTSGSTGGAKPIAKPIAALDREIAMLDTLWGRSVGRRPVLATVPHRHVFGLTFHLLWPVAAGRPFASHIDELWETLLARDPADAVLVIGPTHLARIDGLAPLPLGRRPARVFTAGAPLQAAEARAAAAVLGVLPTEIFGSTEMGAIATRTQHGPDTPWTPLPGIRVKADAAGCMVVHSPFGPQGPPFSSADRIAIAPGGDFHFLGRADRIAKIAGKRVDLARLEEAMRTLPLVADPAATVLAGPPERLAAAVVLTEEGRAQLDQLGTFRLGRVLRRQLAELFEPAWLPKSWRFVAALPRNAMGKRRAAELRALFPAEAERVT